ncbi:MAG: single-stranded-DNA-specific exonuclease RecJ [Treponemataceae bacterium]
MNIQKIELDPLLVKDISIKYNCDPLLASILVRREIISGEDIFFFLENDPRYLHNPFLFTEMEDAVDRIFSALDEGEKVLIFGDRDADGITSTVLLYKHLKQMGFDVSWRLPRENDSYGLSLDAINDFAKNDGTLIITVDCGISNNVEIAHASDLGIDVIIVDHHDMPPHLPEPSIIINPKMEDCGYPFKFLSGCGVTFKLVTALHFAKSDWYKQQVCLFNVHPLNDAFCIDVIKTVNCREIARISETFILGETDIHDTRLLPFLQGQQIFVWDGEVQQSMLKKMFGQSIEFNFVDIRNEIAKIMPSLASMSLLRLAPQSKMLRYFEKASSEIDCFFNLFITFMQKKIIPFDSILKEDLQLVTLSTLADIVPLKNENRIMTKLGLQSLNTKPREGLQELLFKQNLLGKRATSTDISWNIIPLLNATGRLGKPELAVQLFIGEEAAEREQLALQIIDLNNERKKMGIDVWPIVEKQAYEMFEKFDKKIIFVYEPQIHRGLTGLVAGKLMQQFKLPAMVMTKISDERMSGSVRSTRGFEIHNLLASCADIFLNHGGHAYAGGFSLHPKKLGELESRVKSYIPFIEFSESGEQIYTIDAEIPHAYFTPEIANLVDKLEPYGESNKPLVFLVKKAKIISADIMGKVEAKHLKLTLSIGKYKWPALFWNASERYKRDFEIGDFVDIVFQLSKNIFNGTETSQIIISDLVVSD